MNKSSGVVALRVVLAVVLLSLIFTCVYFFIIKARDDAATADNMIFQEYNTTLSSDNVTKIETTLGGLEVGAYYTYAESNGGLGYKEAYLSLYASQYLLSANDARLIIVKSSEDELRQHLTAIQNSATTLMRSIIVFNTSKESYGASPTASQSAALLENFKTIVRDLRAYASNFAALANTVFVSTSAAYYEGVSPFSNAQYMYNYCLNKQIAVYNAEINKTDATSTATVYLETKQMVAKFGEIERNHYIAQTTDACVSEVLGYFAKGVNFDAVLSSAAKVQTVNAIEDTEQKSQARKLLVALGLAEGV